MIFGYRFAQVIYVAAELGLADLLADRTRTVEDLADATGSHAPSLHRLLHALASLEVVTETEPGRYGLAELGRYLQSESPGSVRALTTVACQDASWRAWGQLLHSVRTGEPGFDHVTGMSNFDYAARNADFAAGYHEAMARDTADMAPTIAADVDFSRFHTVVDVGGGSGALMSAILAATPGLRGVLFDKPDALRAAQHTLESAGVADRCEIVAGDFLDKVSGGGQAYLLKYIVLDWDDESVIAILRNCHEAMPADGTLILIELMLPPRPDISIAMGDIDLMVTTGGRERTQQEFRGLLEAAGFLLTSVTALSGEEHMKVLEAVPHGKG
ncbi:methyltransferase [Actinomadura sp. 6N118]|uniref:methyltransferase n=1 Tax=Actinomadura sp. 6N118 TaxID=3375151 RepID=UPI0037AD8ABD